MAEIAQNSLMTPKHFPDSQSFRAWLKKNHASAAELTVGFHRISTGKKSITYPQALDEALCFGWIDGVRHSPGDGVYTIRFTPRKTKSNWSFINIRRAKELIRLKRMTPAGFKAFEKREERQAMRHSEQRKNSKFSPAQSKNFRANATAWKFFQAQPPSYRSVCTFWVVSAAKVETRERRLQQLISDSAAGRRIRMLANTKKS
jgi:uncharacterized protein YdeI (YjbR/CyaY-like superfamily)